MAFSLFPTVAATFALDILEQRPAYPYVTVCFVNKPPTDR